MGEGAVVDLPAAAGGAALFEQGGLAVVEVAQAQGLGGAAEELLGHVPAVLRDDLAAQALGGTAGRGQAPQLLRADGDAGVLFEQAFVLGQLVGLAVVAAAHAQETGAHE